MDWPIKSHARVSFSSGRPFAVGERVACVIFRAPEGLMRADLSEPEAAEWQAPGEVLGRWVREVNDEEDERARKRQDLASAEEMFLAMVQEPGGAGEDKELLLQFLALILERKRVLRAIGRAVASRQKYFHPRLQQEFSVFQHPMTAERIAALSEQLHFLAS
jgi:hypothetical protein